MNYYITFYSNEIKPEFEDTILIPIKKYFYENNEISVNDIFILFCGKSQYSLANYFSEGVYRVINTNIQSKFISKKISFIERSIIVQLKKQFDLLVPPSTPIKEIIHTNNQNRIIRRKIKKMNPIGLNKKLKSKNQAITYFLPETNYNNFVNFKHKIISELEDTLKAHGIRNQNKLESGWFYDIGEKKIVRSFDIVLRNMEYEQVTNFIKFETEKDIKKLDQYYKYIENIVNENILGLEWDSFEILVRNLVIKMGFEAYRTQRTRDGGLDVVAKDSNIFTRGIYLIECKRYKKEIKVSLPEIKIFESTVREKNAIKGIFITTSDFSREAKEFAENSRILETMTWQEILAYINKK